MRRTAGRHLERGRRQLLRPAGPGKRRERRPRSRTPASRPATQG